MTDTPPRPDLLSAFQRQTALWLLFAHLSGAWPFALVALAFAARVFVGLPQTQGPIARKSGEGAT